MITYLLNENDIEFLEKLAETNKQYLNNDSGNAELIAQYIKERYVFDADSKRFLFFDRKRWVPDKENSIYQEVIKAFREEQRRSLDIEDNDMRSKAVKFYIQSENYMRINSCLKIAQTIPGVVVRNKIFDKDDHLLNVQNGTVNLIDGTLKPHDKRSFITKLCPVNYDPDAKCPTMEKFINEIMGDNKNLIEHVQLMIGYFLSGFTNEQKLFIYFGSGRNGKSTLIEIMRKLLGDYAVNIPIEALMSKDTPSMGNEIVRLRGARLATTGEVEQGKRLAENQAKLLTGNDTMTARALYSESIEFRNKAKIVMGTNHLPGVRGQELGLFRRFDITPFNVTIPNEKVDKKLFEKLMNEMSGILNFALEGFRKWQLTGLGEPIEITQAVESYKISQDPIANFINEYCEVGFNLSVSASKLYAAYSEWCRDNREYNLSQRKFGTALGERGYSRRSGTGNYTYYIGLNLISEQTKQPLTTADWDELDAQERVM